MSKKESPQFLFRRDFLRLGKAVGLVAFLASCRPTEIFEPTITPTQAEPVVTEVAQVPTATPEPTPTPEGANILNLMEKAREEGEETFSALDPGGVEVVIDVVPQEVVEEEWSWELRGFTKEVEGQLQVWRTLKGREKDLSQWFEVVSLLDVPGYGNVTIEFDREAMAKKGLTEIYPENPQGWKTVLDIFWGEKQTASIAEPSDYGLIHEKIINREVIPFEIYSFERLARNAGASFVIVPEFDKSFNEAEFWQGKTTVAFKNTAQAGRSVIFMYFSFWADQSTDQKEFNLGVKGLGNLDYFIHQGGQQGIEAMIRQDRNPWIYPGRKLSSRLNRAIEAIEWDPTVMSWLNSPLLGP